MSDVYHEPPWHRIVGVHWPTPSGGQFFYAKHIKIKSGTGVSIASPFDGNVYPPGPAFDPTTSAPDEGFGIEQTGSRTISSSETILLDDDSEDTRHFAIWAQFYAPDPDNPLPTDDHFRAYYTQIIYGGDFDSVRADYDLHGDLIATTGHPR